MNTKLKIIFIILGVLLIDQALKIYIKTHFHYGEDMPLFGGGNGVHGESPIERNKGMEGKRPSGRWGRVKP